MKNPILLFTLFILSIFPSFFMTGCVEKQRETPKTLLGLCEVVAEKVPIDGEMVVCDLSRVKDTVDIPLSYLLSDIEIVRLENREEALVSDAMIWLSDEHIGIYSYQVGCYKLFDRQGKFLADLGKRGQGPNEYFSISDSYIDEEQGLVYLLPTMGQQLLVYNFDGQAETPIPLPYRINKGAFRIDPKLQEVIVAVLPFDAPPSVIWKQDFEGNIIQEMEAGHFAVIPGDFSNEILFQQSDAAMDLSFFYVAPRPDTLYHYNETLNRLQPKLTLKYKNDEIPMHLFTELKHHYLVELISLISYDSKGNPIVPVNPLILIDKKTLKGCYARFKYDMLGGIDGHNAKSWKRGYMLSYFYPHELKEQLESALRTDLPPEMQQKLALLSRNLTEDDNLILLIGKQK